MQQPPCPFSPTFGLPSARVLASVHRPPVAFAWKLYFEKLARKKPGPGTHGRGRARLGGQPKGMPLLNMPGRFDSISRIALQPAAELSSWRRMRPSVVLTRYGQHVGTSVYLVSLDNSHKRVCCSVCACSWLGWIQARPSKYNKLFTDGVTVTCPICLTPFVYIRLYLRFALLFRCRQHCL